jgi:hypothetical protein
MTGKTILIVGGAGVFGSRIAERLAREADFHLIIAGRDLDKARRQVAMLMPVAKASLAAAMFDATHPDSEALRALMPAVIINASGPFQAQNYALAEAAIAASVHYIDLADARAFVVGIGVLDAKAQARRVLVTSGASSVPAISAAVVDHLVPRFARLHAIDIAIVPGNAFDPGLATTQSILAGLDVPMIVRQNGHDGNIRGWEYIGRRHIPGLGNRWVANVDVPDLELFPKRYTGVDTVTFGAGVEVGAFHLSIATLAFMKRIRLIAKAERLAGPLLALKRRLSFLGSDRGGMAVQILGPHHDGTPQRIDWCLVAGSGHGPYVPTVVATILARKLARGEMDRRGAMPCLGLVPLQEIVAEFGDLDIACFEATAPLYRRLLGNRFATLPETVRALHDVERRRHWVGNADVTRGRSPVARALAALFSLPPEGRDQRLRVTFDPHGRAERWLRDFPTGTFRSTQSQGEGVMVERVGPVRFAFALDTREGDLRLKLKSLHIMGLPVPRRLHPAIETREFEEGGRYHFDVASYLPWGPLLVRYSGWLEPEDTDAPDPRAP